MPVIGARRKVATAVLQVYAAGSAEAEAVVQRAHRQLGVLRLDDARRS